MIEMTIAKVLFRNTQIGILVKIRGRWIYYGLVPIMGEPRTMQIMNKHQLDG